MDRELKGEVREVIAGLLDIQKQIRKDGTVSEGCYDGISALQDSLESVRDGAEEAFNALPEQKKYSSFGEALEEELSILEDTIDLLSEGLALQDEEDDVSQDLLDILYDAAEMLNDISRPAG